MSRLVHYNQYNQFIAPVGQPCYQGLDPELQLQRIHLTRVDFLSAASGSVTVLQVYTMSCYEVRCVMTAPSNLTRLLATYKYLLINVKGVSLPLFILL
jgi:hypothetical protein